MLNYLRYYLKYYLKNYPKLFYLIKKINRKFISFSNFIYPTHIFESERLLFKKIYPHCKIVFDVGARFDVDYIEISKGNQIEYHLFEINPLFFEKLKKKLSLFNNTERIIANNIGIGDRAGFLDYFVKTQSLFKRPTDEPRSLVKLKKLPIITLHSYLKKKKIKRIDFLKTDIEYYDYFALLGLKSYLKKIKFIQFELGLGAKLNNRGSKKHLKYVGVEHYLSILKKDFVLYFLKDENNPIWKKSNLKNKDLILFNKKDISNIIKFNKVGIGFNIFAISKKINISILGLQVSRDKVPDFNEFKYLN